MEDRDLSRDAGREGAGATQLRHGVAVAHEHVGRRSRRRGLTSIKRHDLAGRQADEHEAPAAEAGVMAVDHAKHQTRDDRRIDRIATLAHDLDPRLASQVMHRSDHTTTRFFGCLTHDGQQHEHEQGQSLHGGFLPSHAAPDQSKSDYLRACFCAVLRALAISSSVKA